MSLPFWLHVEHAAVSEKSAQAARTAQPSGLSAGGKCWSPWQMKATHPVRTIRSKGDEQSLYVQLSILRPKERRAQVPLLSIFPYICAEDRSGWTETRFPYNHHVLC